MGSEPVNFIQCRIAADLASAMMRSSAHGLLHTCFRFITSGKTLLVHKAIIFMMKETRARVSEIFSASDGPGARIECASALRPSAGQYLLARVESGQQILPVPLFVERFESATLIVPPPIPLEWYPGLELWLRGPLGVGFHPPAPIRHLLLADLGYRHARRLLGLADAAGNHPETVLLSDDPPSRLPVEIEVLPLKSLGEILPWADYAAFELPLRQLKTLRALSGLSSITEFPAHCEALIDTPLICGGIAACGVCCVKVNHGWGLACKDGPVFRLNQLSEDE